jgi:hypothetical protein
MMHINTIPISQAQLPAIAYIQHDGCRFDMRSGCARKAPVSKIITQPSIKFMCQFLFASVA